MPSGPKPGPPMCPFMVLPEPPKPGLKPWPKPWPLPWPPKPALQEPPVPPSELPCPWQGLSGLLENWLGLSPKDGKWPEPAEGLVISPACHWCSSDAAASTTFCIAATATAMRLGAMRLAARCSPAVV